MRLAHAILILSSLRWMCCFSFQGNAMSLVDTFLSEYKISSVVVFLCQQKDVLKIAKYFMGKGVRVKIQNIDEPVEMSSLLSTEHSKLAVLLDLQCERGSYILEEASKNNFFDLLHFWLAFLGTAADNRVINDAEIETNGTRLLSSEDPLLSELESLLILLNSQFTLVRSGSRQDQFLLQDVYRILPDQSLLFTPPRKWSPGQKYPESPKRDDFGGVTLQSATVMMKEDIWEYFMDPRYKHINSYTKKGYAMTERLATHLNFKLNVTPTWTWGYPRNVTSTGVVVYDGILGMLQRREMDLSSTGLLYKLKRLDIVDYSGDVGIYEGRFIFLKPSLSDITNIYILPFTRSVWLTYFLVLSILTAAMFIVQNAESKMTNAASLEPMTVSEAVITSIAVVCQEGTSRDPKNFSARILFLSLLMLSLFVTVSYSAIIISLLQTTSSAIQTLTDLMDSPFDLTMKEFISNVNYINETTDPVIKRLYYTKILVKPHSEAFTASDIGVRKIRKGMHAFHGDEDAYKIIRDTFEEHEKCKLNTIKMYPTPKCAIVVQKGSPYKEYFERSFKWLRENGILDREDKYWITQFPKCQGNAESFTSVRIQDFYPALLVLVYGAALAVGVLVLENLYSRLKSMKIDKLKTMR